MKKRAPRRLWLLIRRIWITIGLLATAVFVGWSLWAYRPTSGALEALRTDDRVAVIRGQGFWRFEPQPHPDAVGLAFFAGALVDPRAYAPLARVIAEGGHPVLLVELPRRGAFGGANGPEVGARAHRAMLTLPAVRQWVVAGHSLGGAIAARLVFEQPTGFAGLVLVGTSHPRDFSLARLPVPVTQIYGTRDTIADVDKLEANRHNLPASTRRVPIDGGNHSQFGYYGFQPGDWPATISREQQQRATVQAIVEAMRAAAVR
ncbi:MAG TPA: alpha/beta family hydrolase [Vicinamibacterales bacterium]|nr:alpha/beta family hydrolase [Vicinamibacterales bacterium]